MSKTVIAHRGCAMIHPENSIAAVKSAYQVTSTVEIDVQLTRDNVVVVFHDKFTTKMTGEKLRVEKSSFQELEKLQLLVQHGKSEETIPRLEDILELLRVDGTRKLVVDCKSYIVSRSLARFADFVYQKVVRAGVVDQVIFSSYAWWMLNYFKKISNRKANTLMTVCPRNSIGSVLLHKILVSAIQSELFLADYYSFSIESPPDLTLLSLLRSKNRKIYAYPVTLQSKTCVYTRPDLAIFDGIFVSNPSAFFVQSCPR